MLLIGYAYVCGGKDALCLACLFRISMCEDCRGRGEGKLRERFSVDRQHSFFLFFGID